MPLILTVTCKGAERDTGNIGSNKEFLVNSICLGWIHLDTKSMLVILLKPDEGKNENLSGTSQVDSKDETHWVSAPGVGIQALELITAYLMMT